MNTKRSALALAIITTAAAACSKSGTQPSIQNQAAIGGRVAETQPEPSPLPVAGNAAGASAAGTAKTVTVAEVASDGTLKPVATGTVDADGSFVVSGVPAGRSDLVVDAEASDGTGLGRVTAYGQTRIGDTLTVAPIDGETTVRALAWADLKANGKSGSTSPEEMALLIHTNSTAAASILSGNDVETAADGAAEASDAMSKVFVNAGASLSASARAKLLAKAVLDFQNARGRGVAPDSAHIALVNAALDAYENAGVSAEALVEASAAAASTLDAQVHGSTSASVRGGLDAEAVWMNLMARERLAAKYESGAEDSLALSIMNVLASTEAHIRAASTATDIHAAMVADATAADSAVVGSMVRLLVPNATALLQSQVRADAQAALDSASLTTRLATATNANAAAQAVANYHSAVKAAVEAMLNASGRTDVDANVLTSLYIAARGGAYIRAS